MLIATLIALTTLIPISIAQQPPFQDALADKMIGDWVMTGIIHGQETTQDIHAEWALKHQYVRIREVSREKNDKGLPQYEAEVYIAWNPQAKQYGCVWLDDFGGASAQRIAYAKPDGNKMAFIFNGDDIFHTTFIYDAKTNGWEWRMDSEKDGKMSPFLRARLTKKS